MRLTLFLFTVSLAISCSGTANNGPVNVNASKNINSNVTKQSGTVPVSSYEVVHAYPHDPTAFTEGLFYHNGFLYESTGQERHSTLRKVELETGKVVQKFDLPPESFGEGISLINDKIYQLTWEEGVCRVFDANDFHLIKEFNYQGEGWGMTTDGTNLYLTNRTHIIQVMNPDTFKMVRTIPVFREDGRPLLQINELEWIKGEIWSNVWHSEEPEILGKPNYIARVDPSSGKLLGWIDLDGISPGDQGGRGQDENTLNGIAYDAQNDRIFVTGKNWKKLYEIKLKDKPAQQ